MKSTLPIDYREMAEETVLNSGAEYGSTATEDAADSLTVEELYEKIGLGRAQLISWTIVALVSYLYYAELTVMSIIMPTLRCQWELSSEFEGGIVLAVFGSYALFGIFCGKLGDLYGRKWVIFGSTVLLVVTAVCSAAAPNKWVFLACRFLEGACIGTKRSSIACYAIEFAESKRRTIGITVNILATFAGLFLVNVLGWAVLDSIGWRGLILIATMPAIPALILLLYMPESPHYLCAAGKVDEAERAINFIASLNNVKLPPSLKIISHVNKDLGSLRTVLNPPYLRSTIALSIIFSANVFLDLGFIVFLPLLFSSDLCGGLATPPKHSCKPLTPHDSLMLMGTSTGGMTGTILSLIAVNIIGRLTPIRAAIVVQTVGISALLLCVNSSFTFSLAAFIMTVESFVKTTVWIMIPESFPTNIRSTAAGFISGCGRIGGIISTFSVYLLFYTHPAVLLGLFLGVSFTGLFGAILMDKETKDISL